MANLKVRRLFDIQPQHVSLVDMPANKRKFIIVKRREESMEIQDVLEQIEKALNGFSDKLDKFEKRFDELGKETPLIDFEIDKKGARFSKDTLSKLKGLRETLGTLLKEYEETGEETTKKEEELSQDDIEKAIEKGFSEGMTENKDGNKDDINDEKVTRIVASVVKALA